MKKAKARCLARGGLFYLLQWRRRRLLLSKSLSTKPTASTKRIYEYDLTTEAGQDYLVYQQGTAIEEIVASDKEQADSNAESILYDLQGRMTKGDNKGIYIEKIFKDGKTNYRKIWKN